MKIVRNLLFLLVAFGFLLFLPSTVEAQRSFHYDRAVVDIDVNQDSTMTVTEEFTYRFNGTYHAVFRDIKLTDFAAQDLCETETNTQCGGFEYIDIVEVKGDNVPLRYATEEEYEYDSEGRVITGPKTYTSYVTYGATSDLLRVQWVFSEPGRTFNNETLVFTVKYDVYGGIGYFEDYDLFYWNVFFEDRDEFINEGITNINFPTPIPFDKDDLKVFGAVDYEYAHTNDGKTVSLRSTSIPPQSDYTVLYRFPKGIIYEYATLNLDLNPSPQNMTINGIELTEIPSGAFAGIPPGKVDLVFSAEDRKSFEITLELAPGEVRDLEVDLGYTTQALFMLFLLIGCNIIGVLLLPVFAFVIYYLWKNKGKDKGETKTPIPMFSPPEGMQPYLLGSIKDEHLETTDITSTFIDLAYRGFIKIKEFKGKEFLGLKVTTGEFELIKIKEKDLSELNEFEKNLMDSTFKGKDRISVSDLKNKFYKYVSGLEKITYRQLVNQEYFTDKPDKVRNKYRGAGCGLFILSFILFGFLSSTGVFFFVGLLFAVMVSSVTLFAISKYMPAKTQKGTDALWKIKGFKMYMETAEKHRVQNLTPENFEKYLSYAIVFGIEEKWAEKFKDIYKGKPDWYESDRTTFNTLLLANSLSRFNNTTSTAMRTTPSSSGSSTGGGWSGGGGFSGGFSGGGGGGGGGGAW